MRLLITVIFVVLSVMSCGGGDGDGNDTPDTSETTVNVDINESLLLVLGDTDTLLGDISIDGGVPVSLSIDIENSIASVTFVDLDEGSYTIHITYSINQNSIVIPLSESTFTQQLTPATGNNFSAINLDYLDTDLDGFTNITEITSGHDWNNSADIPDAAFPMRSSNYIVHDRASIRPVEGSPVAGTMKSTNYDIKILN